MAIEFHSLANIFPLLEGEEFAALVEDVRAKGVLEPITIFEEKILEGRNRYRAATEAGVECPLSDYVGDDPLGFVVSLNLKRRHLNESQRQMVAAKLANMPRGGDRRSDQSANLHLVSQEDAAEMLNVSRRGLNSARTVQEKGIPELTRAVEQGKVPVSSAAEATQLSPEKQREIVASPEPAKAVRNAIKRHRRELREIELAGRQQDMPEEKFAVIYADPPWRFEPRSRETGMDRAADNHYPTEEVQTICSLPVPVADDSVCFLWVTRPMAAAGFIVLSCWGFTYKTMFVWRKPGMGTGYWNRDNAELLYVGVRGEVPAPAMGDQFLACFDAPKGKHSSKPEFVRHIIDSYFPHLSKLELFARGEAPDKWTFWGNEIEAEALASADKPAASPAAEPRVDKGSAKSTGIIGHDHVE